MIITDAEIEETPLLERSICDGCAECAASCPLGAIDTESIVEMNVCGKVMKVAKIDYELCKICKNGAKKNRLTDKGRPDRIAALCNRCCVCHLEEKKRLENQFENPFRKREIWSVDEKGRVIKNDKCDGGKL
jgi:MinD superfamily P-loop ATPase